MNRRVVITGLGAVSGLGLNSVSYTHIRANDTIHAIAYAGV